MLQIDPLKAIATLVVSALPILAVVSCSSFSADQVPTPDAEAPPADGAVSSSGGDDASPSADAAGGGDFDASDCAATLGQPVVLGSMADQHVHDRTGTDTFDAYKFVASADATVHCAHIKIDALNTGVPGDLFTVAIYGNASQQPGEFIGSANLNMPAGPYPAFASGGFESPFGVSLFAGVTYWIVVGGHPSFDDEVKDCGSTSSYSVSQSTLPKPWNGSAASDDCEVVAYVN